MISFGRAGCGSGKGEGEEGVEQQQQQVATEENGEEVPVEGEQAAAGAGGVAK